MSLNVVYWIGLETWAMTHFVWVETFVFCARFWSHHYPSILTTNQRLHISTIPPHNKCPNEQLKRNELLFVRCPNGKTCNGIYVTLNWRQQRPSLQKIAQSISKIIISLAQSSDAFCCWQLLRHKQSQSN